MVNLKKYGGRKPKSAEERFHLSHVKDDESGCWNWLGSKPRGYGRIKFNQRPIRAHRFSWILYRGSIPYDMLVCHKCDNRACVNPDHLFLGTDQDNSDDKVRKNRQAKGDKLSHPRARGEKNGNGKLKENQVIDIFKSNLPQRRIALQYSITQAMVNSIKKGRAWKWLTIQI